MLLHSRSGASTSRRLLSSAATAGQRHSVRTLTQASRTQHAQPQHQQQRQEQQQQLARSRLQTPSSSRTTWPASAASARRAFATTPRRRQPTRKTETKPYLLADVGEGITECEVVKWFIKAGETVQEFDPICEVQSDKASVEITSRYAGVVTKLMYGEGDVARVGTPLCEIEVESEVEDDVGAAAPSQGSTPPEAESGQLKGEAQQPTNDSQVGEKKVELEGFIATPPSQKRDKGEILATPAVRRVSREHNIDLADVQGTGRDGRITKEDVLRFIENPSPASSKGPAPSAAPSSSSASAPSAPASETQVEDLSPVRRAMFRAMTSTLAVPHFAYSDEVDVTALESIRQQLSDVIPAKYRKTLPAASAGTDVERVADEARFDKLTLLPLLLKALSLALDEHPLFRSTLSLPADAAGMDAKAVSSAAKLHRRASHDISIALSSRVGLLTPCLPGVDRQSVFDIAASVTRLQTLSASRSGLSPSDLRATGTVTLSNIGTVGGTYTHPLIPPTGQLAIGAMGRSRHQPRFASDVPGYKKGSLSPEEEDRIVKRLIMPVSFTGDHRVLEGVELARFVGRWKQLVERPDLWFGLLK
ncbi:related to CHL1 - protein of the DEAH box family [Pseudozyma flocculosa]|uniref:Dihydrolipoamide acetyltransferase component of pyruvate dehydrogenase complex n=1 Tax=Pseudozyma flocculosa TaxID=84751 RepID=A0A5C3F9Z1_9BASI|nr:related to CHL1 - protein of the DEAH box family [Pseudozyma flocculosa]